MGKSIFPESRETSLQSKQPHLQDVSPLHDSYNKEYLISEYGPVVQEEMSFKGISYLELWQSLCSAERNHLCNFGRGCYEEHISEIILNFGQWFKR